MNNLKISRFIYKNLHDNISKTSLPLWNTSDFKSITPVQLGLLNITHSVGGLKFKVNTDEFKGDVIISMNISGSFDCYFCSLVRGRINIKYKIKKLNSTLFPIWIGDKLWLNRLTNSIYNTKT